MVLCVDCIKEIYLLFWSFFFVFLVWHCQTVLYLFCIKTFLGGLVLLQVGICHYNILLLYFSMFWWHLTSLSRLALRLIVSCKHVLPKDMICFIKNDLFPWKLYPFILHLDTLADNHRSVVNMYTPLVASYVYKYIYANPSKLASEMQYVVPRWWHATCGHRTVPWQKVFLSRRLKVTGVFHSPLQSTYRSDVIFLSKFT